MPIGGIDGGLIGSIDGDMIGQIVGGQIGGRSIELLHSGCISPFTHWHVQPAMAAELAIIQIKMAAAVAFALIPLSAPSFQAVRNKPHRLVRKPALPEP